MKQWMQRWFAIAWRSKVLRLQLAAEYNAIGRAALADIAMRNFVFESPPDGLSQIALNIIDGRRRAALEILQMARVRPQDLADLPVALTTEQH